jgi:hypothetical protein
MIVRGPLVISTTQPAELCNTSKVPSTLPFAPSSSRVQFMHKSFVCWPFPCTHGIALHPSAALLWSFSRLRSTPPVTHACCPHDSLCQQADTTGSLIAGTLAPWWKPADSLWFQAVLQLTVMTPQNSNLLKTATCNCHAHLIKLHLPPLTLSMLL